LLRGAQPGSSAALWGREPAASRGPTRLLCTRCTPRGFPPPAPRRAGTKSFLSAYDSKDFDVFEKRYLQLARQQASRPSLCGISFAHRSVLLLPVLTPGQSQ
jgi:hypothetical protein